MLPYSWVHIIVPNDRELQLYQRTTPVQGIIVLCTRICPMNTCRDIHVRLDGVKRRTKLFITVNGSPVINVQKLDGCNILEGDDGIRWGNKDQFELRFRINAPGTLHMLKISPMIVFCCYPYNIQQYILTSIVLYCKLITYVPPTTPATRHSHTHPIPGC